MNDTAAARIAALETALRRALSFAHDAFDGVEAHEAEIAALDAVLEGAAPAPAPVAPAPAPAVEPTPYLRPAARLRLALRAAGYNTRQVTVRDDGGSTHYALRVTVRRADVSLSAIEAIAATVRDVRRDESGEILCGGNTFVDVEYAPEVYRDLAATYATALAAGATTVGPFTVASSRGAWGDDDYSWHHTGDGADASGQHSVGREFTAKRMAIATIDRAAGASLWETLAPVLDATITHHTAETIEARLARLAIVDVTASRRESLALAHTAGVDDATLRLLADVTRLRRTNWIALPAGRYEHLSRGKGWARLGRGQSATWGERVEDGYKAAREGEWVVGSDDGFSRKDQVEWQVRHVQVSDAVWTIAD